jgi:VCBS repeat-containing protein
VLANDTDPDGPNPLTVASVFGGTLGQSITGAYGTFTLSANGQLSFTAFPGLVVQPGAPTVELITYEVTDGQTSSFAVVEINII